MNVQDAVRVARRTVAGDVLIEAKEVLREWLLIAMADPQELVRQRHLCCRRCHGIGHAYQWRDEAEYAQACQAALDAVKDDALPQIPSCEGGFGFKRWLAPVAGCEGCGGEGQLDVFIQDGDKLSPAGRKLFAGIKQTKDGIEIKMRDQDAALVNIARYLGMLTTDVKLKGTVGIVPTTPIDLTDAQREVLRQAVLQLPE